MKHRKKLLSLCLTAALALCLSRAPVSAAGGAASPPAAPAPGEGQSQGDLDPRFAPKGQEELQPRVMPSLEDIMEYWIPCHSQGTKKEDG